jgi:hypothetical protein
MRFNKAVIETIKNLIVLSAVDVFDSSPSRKDRRRPSWVPEHDRHINLRQAFIFLGDGPFRASKDPIYISEPTEYNVLGVASSMIDRVRGGREYEPCKISIQTTNVNDSAPVASLCVEDTESGIPGLWQRPVRQSRVLD